MGDEAGLIVGIIDIDVVPLPIAPLARLASESTLLQAFYKNYREGNLFRCCLKGFQLLRAHPLRSYEIRDIFIYSVYIYGRYLAISNCNEEVISMYKETLSMYSDDEKLLYHYGLCLFFGGKFDEATELLTTLLTMWIEHVPAIRIISDIKNQRIKSNEISILNEDNRNEYYIKAIKDYIAMGYDNVLAVNAGMCNYAVIAAKNGARAVYTSEVDEGLIKIATEIILGNDVHVFTIKKKTMVLDLANGFHEKPSLLIMDIHKYGTLGEGLMSELFYLWKHIMKPSIKAEPSTEIAGEYGVVVPAKLEICCAAIECFELANKYMFPITPDPIPVKRRIRFNVAKLQMVNFGSTKLCSNIEGNYEENQLQILDFKYLTEPLVVFTVNLNDKNDVYRQLHEDITNDTIVSVTVVEGGCIHAIAAWFNYCNVKSDLVMTSNPKVAKSCAWNQATFLLKEPLQVETGTILYLKCKKSNDKVKLYINSWKHPAGSTLKNPVIPPRYPPVIVGNEPERFATKKKLFPCGLDNEYLKMLNDVELIKVLKKTAHYFIINLATETSKLRMLDASPFPFLGLLVMLNVKLMHILKFNARLCCNMSDIKVREFMEYLCLKNKLNHRSFEHLPVECFTEPCWEKNKPFDLIVTDIVKRDGDLNERAIADLIILRACLRRRGFLFPRKVDVLCQLMECKWVEDLSYVTTTKMDDINIRSHMNDYKRNHLTGLSLNKLDKILLSDVFECTTFVLSQVVLDSFEYDFYIPVINNGRVTVAGYWFNFHFAPDVVCYNTYNKNSSYQQAAFTFDEPIEVRKGDTVLVTFKYEQGYMNIKVNKDHV